MTDCDAKMVQMKKFVLLRCENECTKRTYLAFNHKDLQQQFGQLKSSLSFELAQENFNDMFDENAPIQSVQLVQTDDSDFQEPLAGLRISLIEIILTAATCMLPTQ